MQEELTKLIEVVSKSEKTELFVLNNAVVETLKKYQGSPTAKNKKNWDAAKKGLGDAIDAMNKKHFPDETGIPTGFKNHSAVHRYLTDSGYKISISAIYADKTMLPAGKDGLIPITLVNKYIKAKNLSNKTPSAREQVAAAKRLESKAEGENESNRKTRLQNEMLELKIAKERAALFPADAVGFELAKRGQVFRYALEAWAEKSADKIAGIFGADENIAAKILSDLGLDTSLAPKLAVKILEQQSGFIEIFHSNLNNFLNPYSSDSWHTEEMSNLMKEWEEMQKEEEAEVVVDLMTLVESGVDPLTLLSSFAVNRKQRMI